MLKFGNKEFRNLQEQVLKNMQNIANIKEGTAVLSEFGIKVVGEVDSLQDLPSVIDYKTAHDDWEYGDAFAIGTEAPYTLVILTRANDEITADHWFDIGRFPAPGPQGAQGPQGEVGPQGQTGDTGPAGDDAGFGSILATAQTLPAGSQATATVTASGPNTAKEFSFTFGIPKGADGGNPVWGNIQGTLSDQTDLDNALDAKQDTLVSGTNIKTINNESILGSGNIDIQSGGDVTDVEVNGTSVVDAQGVAEITVPVDVSDLNNDAGYITSSALSGYATETWVGQQGYAEAADLATVATTGSYADLTNKPSIPSKTSDLTNDSGYITGVAWGSITGTLSNQTDLNTALSGKQDAISDLATIRSGAEAGATAVQPAAISDMATETWVGQQGYLTSVSWSQVSDKPTFATVATSGDYDDLTNKPTIPAAQVNSDWNASSGVAQILNKPTNLVTTNTAQSITGQKSFSNASFSTRPNFVNGLQFDYGISHEITVKESGSGSSTYNFDFPAASGTLALTSDIPTTMAWANITGKPTFATVATSGSYNDLSDKPTIPTNYVTTNTAQTITGAKTFSDSNGIKLKNSNLFVDESYIYLADLGKTYSEIDKRGLVINTNSTGSPDYGSGGIAILTSPEDSVQGISLVPYIAPNTGTKPRKDLGKPDMQWRNLYLSGNITDGTNSITVANLAKKTTISGTNDGTNWTSLTIGSDTYGLAGGSGSVDWSDILNKPTFATVATSGSYNDLSDKPTIPVVDYPVTDVTVGGTSVVSNKIAAIPALFDGDYDSLTNKPDLSIYAESADLSTVATTGDYDDLLDKPDLSIYAESSSLAAVATSGDYDDLTNKPTIPAAQVNSDWNASSGVAQILNKPTLAAVATSGSYNDLTDKPTIPTVPVTDVTVGGISVVSSGTAVIPAIPDAVSGVNDGTNWTSLTIGSTTKAIPSGGTAYSAGTWIDLSSDTISVSNPYVSLLDGNNLPRVLISNQTSGGSPSFSNAKYCNISPAGFGINDRTSNPSSQYTYYRHDRITVGNTYDLLLPNKNDTLAVATDISTAISSQSKETWTFTVDDGQGGTTTVTKTIVLG